MTLGTTTAESVPQLTLDKPLNFVCEQIRPPQPRLERPMTLLSGAGYSEPFS
jgi:hypothetical protein